MNTQGATIMVVDDDHRNTRLLDAQLRGEGYDTMLAYSGEEALEKPSSSCRRDCPTSFCSTS